MQVVATERQNLTRRYIAVIGRGEALCVGASLWLGAVTAADMDAAIAEAIKQFVITDPERQRRVIVRPIAIALRK